MSKPLSKLRKLAKRLKVAYSHEEPEETSYDSSVGQSSPTVKLSSKKRVIPADLSNDLPIKHQKSKKSRVDESIDPLEKSASSAKDRRSSEPADDNLYNNSKTIYIEGIPYDSNEDAIRQCFAAVGHIASIRLPKWHDSGRLRGYGHIEFTETKYADMALGLDGSYLGNRYIKVEKPLTPKAMQQATDIDKKSIVRPPGCRSVFVKNIPYECTESEVMEAMKVCGPITNVRLPVWGHTMQSKGFAYIDFKREDSSEIAVKKSGILTIAGRPVIIDFETGAPKKGFKSASDVSKAKKH